MMPQLLLTATLELRAESRAVLEMAELRDRKIWVSDNTVQSLNQAALQPALSGLGVI